MVDQALPGRSDHHLRQVARGSVVNLAGALIGALGQVGLVLIVTRHLDTQHAGEFFALTSVFLVVNALSSLGTEAGLGRFLLRYEIQRRHDDIGEALRVTFATVALTTTLFAAVLIATAGPIVDLIAVQGATAPTGLRLLALVLPLASLSDLCFAATRAFGNVGPTVVWDKIGRGLAQPVLVFLVTLQYSRLDFISGAYVAPYAVSLLAGLVTLRRTLRARGLRVRRRTTPRTWVVFREFWSFTWARGMTAVAQLVVQRADIILIAALLSPAKAAIYTAATRFVPLGQMSTLSFQQVLQPRFTVVIAEKDHASLRRLFRTGTVWGVLVAWPIYAVVGAAPLLYLSFFGDAYDERGVWVVVVMAIAMMLGVASGPLDTVILMLGRSGMSLANALVAVAVDIGLCLLLIPLLDITGAALAWFASRVVLSALGMQQVRKLTGATPLSPQIALAGLLSVVLVAAPVTVGTVTGLPTLPLFGLCLLVALLYAAALWVLRRPFELTALGPASRRAESG